MAKIIAITGGKGGTGKSTVATSLALTLSKDYSVLLVDADVDCPNDHLLLNCELKEQKAVYQRIPEFNNDKCQKCGLCGTVCKNKAIVSLKGKFPIFIKEQCNGCGSCELICPYKAISWNRKEIGKIYSGTVEKLSLLSGELKENEPVSEFIVNSLNKEIEAIKKDYDYIIIDTAAGSHCPVIASFELATQIIAVTEPTPLGSHDLEIILKLLESLNKDCSIILNRSDIGDKSKILKLASKYKKDIALEIPYSQDIAKAYSKGIPILIPDINLVIK